MQKQLEDAKKQIGAEENQIKHDAEKQQKQDEIRAIERILEALQAGQAGAPGNNDSVGLDPGVSDNVHPALQPTEQIDPSLSAPRNVVVEPSVVSPLFPVAALQPTNVEDLPYVKILDKNYEEWKKDHVNEMAGQIADAILNHESDVADEVAGRIASHVAEDGKVGQPIPGPESEQWKIAQDSAAHAYPLAKQGAQAVLNTGQSALSIMSEADHLYHHPSGAVVGGGGATPSTPLADSSGWSSFWSGFFSNNDDPAAVKPNEEIKKRELNKFENAPLAPRPKQSENFLK